ncbi:Glycogen debranching enzyme (alpha-1,6-glucosidase) [Arboricoccus pini]|uniref:Glycogen debranching enzyme (Alpha-1,6-glucosidase) n=2 Tax=Arboricoccus pini TaxID=1963835 RepID=A0A212QSK9_9PROT|nr:glycogen debranching N-terminal domain-containing protein [Arboricoccus pini]SNB62573.1 Glycogen debranching enzyme (alpha-1,6-glucosidase) [Arboricoccus pini]
MVVQDVNEELGSNTPAFFIAATSSLQERRPRTLKHGDCFALFDANGDVFAGPTTPEGLFFGDTRHLSRWQLTVGGFRPLLLSSTARDDNASLAVDLTSADLFDGDVLVLPKDTLHISRTIFLYDGAYHERLAIRNFGDRDAQFELSVRYGSDFADLFEIRGAVRPRRGEITSAVDGDRAALFGYLGVDGVRRTTRIEFDQIPAHLSADHATFQMAVKSHGQISLFTRIKLDGGQRIAREEIARQTSWSNRTFFDVIRDARRELRTATARIATIRTSNDLFNELLCRSTADIYMLLTQTSVGPYPYAGVPWFSTVFGRDGLIAAMETLSIDPQIACGVLRFLAREQATSFDLEADAEPGKILHELRDGEMARLGEVPFRRYYGSIDSTPLFVVLAGMYYQRTGDLLTIRQIWPNIEAALTWMDEQGDRDGDGFVEYGRRNDKGLVNQGWKDSYDSVFDRDGNLAEGPIALIEVQAYVFAAKHAASALAQALGFDAQSARLKHEASHLAERVNAAFWLEETGCYAMALDGEKRPLPAISSNAGHALFAGLATPERARRVAERLLSPSMFSGWGVRTIAQGEPRFNPMSYHNGSIWPHDNALIALGFSRYGLRREAMSVLTAIFEASIYVDQRRLPELFCGFHRQARRGPVAYPVACAPQAWAAAAPFALLEACLGLQFDPERRVIRLIRPQLPSFLNEVKISNLTLGDASVDLLLRRHDEEVTVSLLKRQGEIDVRVTL